jgi:hypothetical protein
MSLPPLNRLRKGVVVLTFLLFVFILSRLLFYKTASEPSLPEKEPQTVYTEICLLISSGAPVNVDTVFSLKNNISKLYAYTSFTENFETTSFAEGFEKLDVTVRHIWYYGSKEIKNTECTMEDNACFSSISADSLQKGDWSVDTMQGDVLLNIRQFRIER